MSSIRVAFWRSYSDLDPRWSGMIPLYASCLVAHAKHNGLDVEPIHCATADAMVSAKADYYCVSSVTPTWAEALSLIQRIKGRKVIVGGPHITCLPSQTPEGCIGVVGEGERFTMGSCSFSAAFARPETLAPLKRMGLKSLGIGMESASPVLHKKLKPHMNFAHNERLIELAKEFDLQIGASFIVGTPGETEADLAATEAFILKHKGPHFKQNGLFTFAPLPGSKAWDELLAAGRVSEDMDWSEFTIGADASTKHAWFNDNMSYEIGMKCRKRISLASRM